MAAEAPHQESTSSSTSWELQVKHGASTLALSVGAGATGAQLLDQVAAAAGTLARQLKLIHKGKVLDPGRPLAAQGVGDGAKLMALGGSTPAQGPGVTTVGAKVASAASQAKAAEVKARLEAHFGGKGGGGGGAAAGVGARAAAAPSSTAAGAQPVSHLAERQRTWRATGIMTLRELGLASLPPALLAAPGTQGPHAAGEGNEEHAAWLGWSGAIKHLDACRNVLTCVPAALGALGATLTTLKLSHNQLGDAGPPPQADPCAWCVVGVAFGSRRFKVCCCAQTPAGVPWEALASLQGLTHLALDHNQLHSLKEDGGWMHACGPRLRVLDVSHNRLSGLPAQGLAALSRLQLLQADSNQLTALPDELGEREVGIRH